jgi:hypothetical protein
VVQQNSSKESLQSAFREVLDPQIVVSLQDQFQSLRHEMELHHGLQVQQHNFVHSEMQNQSRETKVLLDILKQHVSHSTFIAHEHGLEGARERRRFAPAGPVESRQNVDVNEVLHESSGETDDIKVMKNKIQDL